MADNEQFPRRDMITDPRGWTEMHDLLAEYIEAETGYAPDTTTIRLAFALRNDFRKTQEYADLRAARVEAREAKKAAKAQARKEREAKKAAEAAASSEQTELVEA